MFKAITTNALDIKKEAGKAHVGTYVGHNDIETPLGKQVVWNFVDEEELPFGVYGFTMLNRAMNSVPVNKLVRITYIGTKNVKTKFGMKDVHQVNVEVDDGVEPDVPGEKIPF